MIVVLLIQTVEFQERINILCVFNTSRALFVIKIGYYIDDKPEQKLQLTT